MDNKSLLNKSEIRSIKGLRILLEVLRNISKFNKKTVKKA